MKNIFFQILLFVCLIFTQTQAIAQASLTDEDIAEFNSIIDNKGEDRVEVARRLSLHYNYLGGHYDKVAHYCTYILEELKDDQLNNMFFRTSRTLAINYIQQGKTDSIHFLLDRMLDLTEGTKDSTLLFHRGEALNVKGGAYVYGEDNYKKGYKYVREALDIGEEIRNIKLYLGAAYSLCDIISNTEPERIPDLVDEISAKMSDLNKTDKSARRYSFYKIQEFKAVYIGKSSKDEEERAWALNLLHKLVAEAERLERYNYIPGTMLQIAEYFSEEIGIDSTLHYANYCYEYAQKGKDSKLIADSYILYGQTLHKAGQYQKSIEVLEAILPSLGYDKINEPYDKDVKVYYKDLTTVFEYLSRNYEQIRNRTAYSKYFDLYTSTIEKRELEALDDAASRLEIEYDTEKQELLNQALVSENKLIQNRLKFSLIIAGLLLGLLGASIYFFLKMRQNKRELERINAGKNKLFTILAHDLKDPVSSFSNLASKITYLIRKNEPERLLELAKYFETAGNRINYILVNLLDWAISQKDQFVHSPQDINVKEEVATIIQDLEYALAEKEISIDNRVGEGKSLYFDKNSLQVIVRNLLHNAVKFSDKDSTIIVDFDEFGLKVKDKGVGMKPETVKSILKSERVESRLGTNDERGNGIGLSTCIKLAEQNNAKLKIDTKIGEGTVFTLSMTE